MADQPSPQEAIAEQKKHCPFCKIVSGEIPADKIYEDEVMMAIADINPIAPGHLLVFPKEHYPLLPMIPESERSHFFSKIGYISKGQRDGGVLLNNVWFIANGGAAGQRSPHFMVHLLPESSMTQELFAQQPKDIDMNVVQQLEGMLKQYLGGQPAQTSNITQEQRAQLAQRLQNDQELLAMIKDDPQAAAQKIHDDHELAQLFAGVDIVALAQRLKQGGQ